jgi:hypothetical protein
MLILFAAATRQASAQLGVTMQVPAALGFIWHATDKVALRPDFNLTTSRTSSSGVGGGVTDDGLTWGVALSTPYYVTNQDNVRTYVSPRVGYMRSTSSVSTGVTSTSTSNQLVYSGSFGAQYAPIRWFNVFGETGYAFTSIKNSSTAFPGTASSSGWSVRSTVGVILYFGH